MHGKPLVYLDSAATAKSPSRHRCDHNFYRKHYGTVHRAIYELSIHATKNIKTSAKASPIFSMPLSHEEIIYTRGTTESINMVAYSFGKAFVPPEMKSSSPRWSTTPILFPGRSCVKIAERSSKSFP